MQPKVYFKNLNSLRFFAALIVLMGHVEPLKKAFGIADLFEKDFFTVDSKFGVLLFFVLSGFLISYLLMEEIKFSGTINIKAFYIRRALRIWPLYFLIIALALLVFPYIDILTIPGYESSHVWDHIWIKLLFLFLLLPNLAFMLGGNLAYAAHIWTIGVEEQFYLIWPWLFKKINNKVNICLTVIFGYIAVYYLLDHFSYVHKQIMNLKIIWGDFPISCLAIGGLYACLIFMDTGRTKKIRTVIFNFWFQLIMMALLIVLLLTKFQLPFCDSEFYSLLLGYHVCNFAANTKTIFSLENKLFSYLGKISYGIYMFHPVVIILGLKLTVALHLRSIWLLHFIVLLISIAIAAISYHFYESYFIKKKMKYSKVVSGDNASTI